MRKYLVVLGLLLALAQAVWAQSPSTAPAPASSIPAAAVSAAPASAAPAAATSAAPAPAISAAPASAAPAASTSAAPSAAVSAAPSVAASGSPAAAPAMPMMTTEIKEIEGPKTSFVADFFQTLSLVVYFAVCVALVICVMLSPTKNEGLTGIIGGGTSTAMFKGKKSAEEQLSLWTGRLAWTFLVSSLCIWLVMQHG